MRFALLISIAPLILILATPLLAQAEANLPVDQEFTDGETLVDGRGVNKPSSTVTKGSSPAPAATAERFPAQAATAGTPLDSLPGALTRADKPDQTILGKVLGLLRPTKKDLRKAFNDDAALGAATKPRAGSH